MSKKLYEKYYYDIQPKTKDMVAAYAPTIS